MATTKVRYFRVGDELWERVQTRARVENVTVSELVRSWLEAYANDDEIMSIPTELTGAIDKLISVRKRLGGERDD